MQQYEATLDTCVDGCDVTLQRCIQDVCEDVSLTLTPGDWIISFSYNAPAFNLVSWLLMVTCGYYQLLVVTSS